MAYPDFFIVVTVKAATTTLYHYFSGHPDVFVCPIKEPHYFSRDFILGNFRKDYRQATDMNMASYLSRRPLASRHIAHVQSDRDFQALFEGSEAFRRTGDFSTGYLYSTKAADQIAAVVPDAKILMVLRNPIERAYSHYLMDLRDGRVKGKFVENVFNDFRRSQKGWGISSLYVELGQYYNQVQRYVSRFSPDQILILLYKDIAEDLAGSLEAVCNFLV